MLVLYVIDSLMAGGAEMSLVHMAPGYRDQGMELHVAFLKSRWDVAADLEAAGATLHPVALDQSRGPQLRALTHLIRELQPDIVHTTLYESDVLGRLAARAARSVVVTTFANSNYSTDQYRDPSISEVKLATAQVVDAATARLASGFQAVSPSVQRDMARRLLIPRERISVIPRARSRASLGDPGETRRRAVRDTLGLSPDQPVVLAAARHEHQKGLDILVESVATVVRDVPGTVVLIAGREARATRDLHRVVSETGVEGAVRFLGAREDVPDLIVAADVVGVPSRFEGLPGLVLEAMALDTPVVASDIPMVRDAIGDDACALVPVGDAPALAEALARCLVDPPSDAVERARERFEQHYTPKAVVAAMRGLYETAISARS